MTGFVASWFLIDIIFITIKIILSHPVTGAPLWALTPAPVENYC